MFKRQSFYSVCWDRRQKKCQVKEAINISTYKQLNDFGFIAKYFEIYIFLLAFVMQQD